MERYIALLRGINVGGKNKIAMADLKTGFAELGYETVVTHLNSGNVVFSSAADNVGMLTDAIQTMIIEKFELNIPVFVISQKELKNILDNAPDWWGGDDSKEIYDNLILLFPGLTYEEFCVEVGSPKDEYEKAHNYRNAIFWSFVCKDYQKTNWWSKTASSDVGSRITIRAANTVRKITSI